MKVVFCGSNSFSVVYKTINLSAFYNRCWPSQCQLMSVNYGFLFEKLPVIFVFSLVLQDDECLTTGEYVIFILIVHF